MSLLSLHHNGSGPPPRRGRPGTEVYHQADSGRGRLLAQGLWDDITTTLATFDIEWTADESRPGVRSRLGDDGAGYYGTLRYTPGITTVITEAAFVTSPAEAELLQGEPFREAEASALARALDRYLARPPPADTAPVTSRPPPPPPATSVARSVATAWSSPVADPSPTTTVGLPAIRPDAEGCVDPVLE